MHALLTTDGSAAETGRLMRWMAETYRGDMLPYVHMPLPQVFDYIKRVPFRPDPPTVETLMRPAFTLSLRGSGGDCDDKSIALAAYCSLVGIPYRFVAVRRHDMNRLHHVFCHVYIGSGWITADPTYTFNTLGREREPYAEYHIIG